MVLEVELIFAWFTKCSDAIEVLLKSLKFFAIEGNDWAVFASRPIAFDEVLDHAFHPFQTAFDIGVGFAVRILLELNAWFPGSGFENDVFVGGGDDDAGRCGNP